MCLNQVKRQPRLEPAPLRGDGSNRGLVCCWPIPPAARPPYEFFQILIISGGYAFELLGRWLE